MEAGLRDNERVRIDKWLWAVRVFKTRSRAAEACASGNVRVGEVRAKASRGVGIGDIVSVREIGLTRVLRVKGLAEKRMSASRVPGFMEDLTPADEHERRKAEIQANPFRRSKGEGRPTKRERRILDMLRRMD